VSGPSAWEKEAAKVTSEVARRAIRRLDVIEWVILLGAVALSIAGGWLVAAILLGRGHESHRMVWMIVSVVLLVAPGAAALARLRQDRHEEEPAGLHTEDDG
jgi:hypothetical protein